MAQPFDLGRLGTTGEAVPLAENIRTIGANRCGVFSVSRTGVLVYETNSQELRTLAWFDRNGVQTGTLGAPALFRHLELSPDRKTLAASLLNQDTRTRDIWLYDISRGSESRFFFEPRSSRDRAGVSTLAIWAPDGNSLIF